MLTMRRAPDLSARLRDVGNDLDPQQSAAVHTTDPAVLVLGAPGTGKTTVAVESIVAAVGRGVPADRCVVLSPTRRSAAHLRDSVTARLQGTSTEPLARSHQALAFGILRQQAALRGDPAPRLLSGPEQDVVLRELLAGHASGEIAGPPWPDFVREALPTRGFRAELRDLLMRAVEWGLTSQQLHDLGVEHGRSAWVAAAQVLQEYDEVTALSRPGSYDPAWILGAAADAIEDDAAVRDRVHSQIEFVVVDDAQELTHAAARLLRLIVRPGVAVRLIGDPDASVQGFRGSDPRLFGTLATEWSVNEPVVLENSHRSPQLLRDVADRVSSRIGAVGGVQHRTVRSRPGGQVEVAMLRAVAQEGAHVAAQLRRAHLLGGVPWNQMAVIVRGQGRTGALRRAFSAAGVPVSVPQTVTALRDEPAVRPLLMVLDIVVRRADDPAAEVDPEEAIEILSSVLGNADAVAMRRLRRELRMHELASGGARSSDELLAAAVLDTGWLSTLGPHVTAARRVARVIHAGLDAINEDGATAETVLWAMWQSSGLAQPWQESALAGGPAGARADRNLDAVVALFAAAAAYVDRLPGGSTRDFLEHVRGQDVPGDRLVAAAPDDDCVAMLTPQAAAGREWNFVVVAGVQEGVWPDLRLRGSLLGSEALVDVLAGRGGSLRAAQAAVRYDETRQFLVAISRATERLLVTAVRSEDEQPSVYLDLVDPLDMQSDSQHDQLRDFTRVARPMTLPGVVAELRRELAIGSDDERERAAGLLARLAAEQVPGADPAAWWALTELSDQRSLRAPDAVVGVSPSRVEAFGVCGLNWLLTTCGGDGPDIGAATVGTLVHDIAAEFADSAPERMHEVLDERWPRLGLGDGWVSQHKRDEAHLMVERLQVYLDEAKAMGWEPVAVELDFEVILQRAKLRGRVDRLEKKEHSTGAELRVIDYKTGSHKPPKADLAQHPQLAAYQVAVEAGAFGDDEQSGGAALVQLGKRGLTGKPDVQNQPALDSGDEGQWARDLIKETADGMAGATFIATVGTRCGTCSVKRSCPLQPEGGAV